MLAVGDLTAAGLAENVPLVFRRICLAGPGHEAEEHKAKGSRKSLPLRGAISVLCHGISSCLKRSGAAFCPICSPARQDTQRPQVPVQLAEPGEGPQDMLPLPEGPDAPGFRVPLRVQDFTSFQQMLSRY
jgi:hypothetical protein